MGERMVPQTSFRADKRDMVDNSHMACIEGSYREVDRGAILFDAITSVK